MTELIGQIFGDMEIIEVLGKNEAYQVIVVAQCLKCKRTKQYRLYALKQGKGIYHSSCGQGLKLLDKTFYMRWRAMRQRTTNQNSQNYIYYGGRGISSEAYNSFVDFYDDLYESYLEHARTHTPQNTTLERIDVNGDYEPGNVCWATWAEQKGNMRKNRRFQATSPDGNMHYANNQCEFARDHGLSDKQINACLAGRFKTHLGWTFEYI